MGSAHSGLRSVWQRLTRIAKESLQRPEQRHLYPHHLVLRSGGGPYAHAPYVPEYTGTLLELRVPEARCQTERIQQALVVKV